MRLLNPSISILAFLSILSFSCSKAMNTEDSSKPIKQGIIGQLIWLEGNLMPTPEANARAIPQGQTVQRQVVIYEITKTSQAKKDGNFYSDIETKLVKEVMSDKNGIFRVSLEPGKYSLFVKEPQGLFANVFDGYGHIMPVEVFKDEITEVKIEINYMAAY